jgi:ABA sandwich protein
VAELTREQVLGMPAGRELDALVAERVMGWRYCKAIGTPEYDSILYEPKEVAGHLESAVLPGPSAKPLFRYTMSYYSTKLAAAWEVVNAAAYVTLTKSSDNDPPDWFCSVQWKNGPDAFAAADAAPLAVCRAALLAVLAEQG